MKTQFTVGFLFLLMFGPSCASAATDLPSGIFGIASVQFGLCLSVASQGTTTAFGKISQVTCGQNEQQNWSIFAGPNNTFQLISVSDAQCLDLDNNKPGLKPCDGNQITQHWGLNWDSLRAQKRYQFVNDPSTAGGTRCLSSVSSNANTPTQDLFLGSCNSTNSQQFRLIQKESALTEENQPTIHTNRALAYPEMAGNGGQGPWNGGGGEGPWNGGGEGPWNGPPENGNGGSPSNWKPFSQDEQFPSIKNQRLVYSTETQNAPQGTQIISNGFVSALQQGNANNNNANNNNANNNNANNNNANNNNANNNNANNNNANNNNANNNNANNNNANNNNANQSSLEKQVFDETNLLRSNPAAYAKFITDDRSNDKAAIAEARNVLAQTASMSALTLSTGLTHSARDQANDVASGKASFGHTGSDGSNPFDRMNRYGSWESSAGENIAGGINSGRAVIIGYIIDDGTPDRGHRKNLLNPGYHTTGVGCKTGVQWSPVCTSDYAGGYKEK